MHMNKAWNVFTSVIFEPNRKIKLSHSTYNVTSFVDFTPYLNSFKQFHRHFTLFIRDINDPLHAGQRIDSI